MEKGGIIMAVNVSELKERFSALFGSSGEAKAYFAPGRVNLIGEHTDYNGEIGRASCRERVSDRV